MLENVESIDWNSLGHPKVPEFLRQLASNNRRDQVEATDRLEAEVILGGKDWQSFDLGVGISVALRNDTPLLLVPFLLELLSLNTSDNKPDILYLLSRMLFYNNMMDEGDVYKERSEKVRTAIWEGRLIFADLLSSQNIATRKSALSVLIEFNESTRISETYELIVRRFEPKLPLPEAKNTES